MAMKYKMGIKLMKAGLDDLNSILQESSNCYLYEKLGYRQTGKAEQINDKMTIVFYEKD